MRAPVTQVHVIVGSPAPPLRVRLARWAVRCVLWMVVVGLLVAVRNFVGAPIELLAAVMIGWYWQRIERLARIRV